MIELPMGLDNQIKLYKNLFEDDDYNEVSKSELLGISNSATNLRNNLVSLKEMLKEDYRKDKVKTINQINYLIDTLVRG